MNKKELIEAVSLKAEFSQKDSKIVLDAFMEVVAETLAKEDKIQLVGFGTFEVAEVAERTGIVQMGDKKGETYTTPTHKKPKFKAGSDLKKAVNGITE